MMALMPTPTMITGSLPHSHSKPAPVPLHCHQVSPQTLACLLHLPHFHVFTHATPCSCLCWTVWLPDLLAGQKVHSCMWRRAQCFVLE